MMINAPDLHGYRLVVNLGNGKTVDVQLIHNGGSPTCEAKELPGVFLLDFCKIARQGGAETGTLLEELESSFDQQVEGFFQEAGDAYPSWQYSSRSLGKGVMELWLQNDGEERCRGTYNRDVANAIAVRWHRPSSAHLEDAWRAFIKPFDERAGEHRLLE